MIWCVKTNIIAYVKIQKNEDILSIISNLQPNCLKVDFQKVDQHARDKWLIHDTKRRKDNQLKAWNSHAEYIFAYVHVWVIFTYKHDNEKKSNLSS